MQHGVLVGGAVFDGQADCVVFIGHNVTTNGQAEDPGKPKFVTQYEDCYLSGGVKFSEINTDWWFKGVNRRISMVKFYYDNPDGFCDHRIMISGGGGYHITGPSDITTAGKDHFFVSSNGLVEIPILAHINEAIIGKLTIGTEPLEALVERILRKILDRPKPPKGLTGDKTPS